MATPVRRVLDQDSNVSAPYYLWTALRFAGEIRHNEINFQHELQFAAQQEKKLTRQQIKVNTVKASRVSVLLNSLVAGSDDLKSVAQKLLNYYELTTKSMLVARDNFFSTKMEWLVSQEVAQLNEDVKALVDYQAQAGLAEKIIITEHAKHAAIEPMNVPTIVDVANTLFLGLIKEQDLIALTEARKNSSHAETLFAILNYETAVLVREHAALTSLYDTCIEKINLGLQHEQKILQQLYLLRQQDNHSDKLEMIVGRLVDYFESRNLTRYQDKMYLIRTMAIHNETIKHFNELKEQVLVHLPKPRLTITSSISKKVILLTKKVLPLRRIK